MNSEIEQQNEYTKYLIEFEKNHETTIKKLYESKKFLLSNLEFVKHIIIKNPLYIHYVDMSLLENKELLKIYFLSKISNGWGL